MHPFLNIAVRAARAAGDVIVRHLDRVDAVKVTEKQANDFVTEVDRMAEQRILDVVGKAYPRHGVLAEESGRREGRDYEWVIDPLDGTHNFMHGYPHFAVSIAVRGARDVEHGVVFDPVRQEMFAASRGAGAQVNGRRIRIRRRAGLAGAFVGTGFPHRDMHRLDAHLAALGAVSPLTAGVRRAGAAALDLAYVAAGRLDGFWEYGLKPWDCAAGALLVLESGGLVSGALGEDDWYQSGDVVAAAPKTHGQLLEVLRDAAREA